MTDNAKISKALGLDMPKDEAMDRVAKAAAEEAKEAG